MRSISNLIIFTKSDFLADEIISALNNELKIESSKIIQSKTELLEKINSGEAEIIIVDEKNISTVDEKIKEIFVNKNFIVVLIDEEFNSVGYENFINMGFNEVISSTELNRLSNIIQRERIISAKNKNLQLPSSGIIDEDYWYKELVNNLGEGVIIDRLILDKEGKVIDWQLLEVNQAYEQYMQLKSADVVGKLASEVYGKDEIQDILVIFEKVYKTRNEIKVPRYFPKTKQFFLSTVTPLKDDLILVVFSNITELKIAQKALNESEMRLNLAIEGSQLGLWDQDFKTGKVYRNSYWASMLGYTLDEINSDLNFWEKLLHPDDIEKVQRIKDLHEVGEIPYFKIEHRLKTKSGNYKWVLNWGKISERDEKGKPLRAVGVHIDIDDRKRVSEELIQSQKKYKAIFESTPLGIIAWESNLKIIEWNNGAEAIFGYKKSEAVGRKFDDLIFSETGLQKIKMRIEQLRQGKQLSSIVVQNRTRSGKKIWCEWNDTILVNDYGEITGFLSTVSDITVQRESQIKLTRSEDLYRTLVETSPDGITMTDLDGNIIEVSPRIIEMYGYNNSRELIGKSALDLIVRPERLKAISQMMRGIQSGKTEAREYKMLRKDGSTFYGELNTALIRDPGGNPSRIIGITRDITGRKLNELALSISQSRVEFLAENIDDVIWTMNINGEFTYISPSVTKLRGFTVDEALHQTIDQAVTSEYADLLKQQLTKFLQEPQKFGDYLVFEVDQPKKDGSIVKVELKVKALFDSEGKPKELLGVSRDITERVEANKKLLESEERFRIFMDHIPAGIFIKNEDGIYEFVNRFNEEELNVKDWLGKSAHDYFDKEIADKFAEEDKRILNGEFIRSDVELNLEDGSKKYFKTQYFPIISPTGRKFIGGVSWDVTKETYALSALKESEEKNRAFSEATKEGLVFSENGYCIEANKAACELFGYEYNEFIGLNGTDVVSEEYRDKVKKNMLSNYELPYEVLGKRKDGSKFWVEFEGRMYAYKGRSVRVTAVRDITERKKFIDELERSEENFRSIFENSALGIFRTNPDGKIELANDALANMLGFDSVQEMLDELDNIKKLYKHHKDREFLIDRLAKQGFVRYYEVEANHKSGKQLWLSINAVSSLNPEGEVVYEGTMNDISERMEAEQKLKESEETFMKAFISAPYAIVLTAVEDSSIIDVNDGFVELSGFTREEVIGKITVELNMWVNEQDRLEVINDLMNGIKVRGREYRFRIKNGKEYFGFYSAELINLKNKPVIISSISDITERKIFEEKLIKSEEKFKTLAENALVAISIIDPKDVTKYLYVNKYWEEVTGYSKADIDTISPLDVVHPDMKDIVIEQAGKRIKNEISETRYELKIFTKDKKVKWLDFSSALIEYENKKALLTAGVDITDKRDTEKQLIEKVKELEKLNSFLVGRELKMVELKKEINELFSKLGERPKYTISKDENN